MVKRKNSIFLPLLFLRQFVKMKVLQNEGGLKKEDYKSL